MEISFFMDPLAAQIIENFQDGVICLDLTGRINYYNKASSILLGYSPEELQGQYHTDIITEEFREKFGDIKENILFNEKTEAVEIELVKKSQDKVMVSIQYSPHLDAVGKIIGISAVIRKVGERYKVANKAQSLIETAPDAMIIVNKEGQIVLVNAQAELLFGYAREELLGEEIEMLIPDEFTKEHKRDRTNFIYSPKTRRMGTGMELNGLSKDGSQFPIEISLSPLKTEDGIFISASIRNISERKQAEERFKGLLESAPDAMVIIDQNGNIQLVNSQAENIFGYHRNELIGQKMDILMPERFRYKHPEHRKNYFSSPKVRPMGAGLELLAIRKDGTEFPVEISLSPLSTTEGTIVSAAIRDITDRKQSEMLRILAHETEARNKELEQFAYVASHDLQEPLKTMTSFVELLKEENQENLNQDANQYLDFISQSSKRMTDLINDLLDYSRIGMNTVISKVDLNELIKTIQDDLKLVIAETKTRIILNNLPEINGHETELRILFQNLITNAIKFSKKGVPPIIEITSLREDGHWKFMIRDNGIGIDDNNKEKIFVIFQRLHLRSEYEGTGIGLAHCRKIVENNGGKIWVESMPNKGSTFILTLPIRSEADLASLEQ